jgi:hypothetical protein
MNSLSQYEYPPAPRLQVRMTKLGTENAPLVVIDDFIANPADLVDYAAQSRFAPVSGNLYPGIRAPLPASYMDMMRALMPGIVNSAFGLEDLDVSRSEGDFSLVTTPPQNLEVMQRMPHFDTTDPGQIAVLHYLCAEHMGGTAFYRHRRTGYESISPERSEDYLRELSADLQLQGLPERRYINGETMHFEPIGGIGAAFNRLIVYRSASLHSGRIAPGFRFDPNPRTGRLTANVFLHFRDLAPCPVHGVRHSHGERHER